MLYKIHIYLCLGENNTISSDYPIRHPDKSQNLSVFYHPLSNSSIILAEKVCLHLSQNDSKNKKILMINVACNVIIIIILLLKLLSELLLLLLLLWSH